MGRVAKPAGGGFCQCKRAIYSVAFIGAAEGEREELHGMRGRTPIADFYDLVNSLRPLSPSLNTVEKRSTCPSRYLGGCCVPVVLSQILWTFSASRPFLALNWIAIPRLDGISRGHRSPMHCTAASGILHPVLYARRVKTNTQFVTQERTCNVASLSERQCHKIDLLPARTLSSPPFNESLPYAKHCQQAKKHV